MGKSEQWKRDMRRHTEKRRRARASAAAFKSECGSKVRYTTAETARMHAVKFRRDFGGAHQTPYECRWCGGYHLTKKRAEGWRTPARRSGES